MDTNKIELAKSLPSKNLRKQEEKITSSMFFKYFQDKFNINDQNILVAGLLHDTLEDTTATYEEIEKFSKEVANLVQEVSHPKTIIENRNWNITRELK